MKKVCLKKINLLIGAILVAMGFSVSSCRVEYGCPPEYIDPEDTTLVETKYGCPMPPEYAPQSNAPDADTNIDDNSL